MSLTPQTKARGVGLAESHPVLGPQACTPCGLRGPRPPKAGSRQTEADAQARHAPGGPPPTRCPPLSHLRRLGWAQLTQRPPVPKRTQLRGPGLMGSDAPDCTPSEDTDRGCAQRGPHGRGRSRTHTRDLSSGLFPPSQRDSRGGHRGTERASVPGRAPGAPRHPGVSAVRGRGPRARGRAYLAPRPAGPHPPRSGLRGGSNEPSHGTRSRASCVVRH